MSKIILQPAGNLTAKGHFQATIEHPVPSDRIRGFVDPAESARLAAMYGDRPIPTWGVTPGANGQNVAKWERIASGDVVLFCQDSHVVATATVAYKLHVEALAVDLWGRDDQGQTWEYLYFLDELRHTHIPYRELNRALGYAENYVPQGFNVVDDPQSAQAFAAFDLESAVHPQPVSEDEYYQLTQDVTLDPDKPLDAVQRAKVRKEQDFLRAHLFKGKTAGTCGICGREYPVDLLVAAHIKPRAHCSDSERRDYKHVVMPMCKFGCDDLYEHGYLTVSEQGHISVTCKDRGTRDLEVFLKPLDGCGCAYWSADTEPYFAWHRERHKDSVQLSS